MRHGLGIIAAVMVFVLAKGIITFGVLAAFPEVLSLWALVGLVAGLLAAVKIYSSVAVSADSSNGTSQEVMPANRADQLPPGVISEDDGAQV